jgi:hypothetical protein
MVSMQDNTLHVLTYRAIVALFENLEEIDILRLSI